MRPFDNEQEDIERAKTLGIYNIPFAALVKVMDERIARCFGVLSYLIGPHPNRHDWISFPRKEAPDGPPA